MPTHMTRVSGLPSARPMELRLMALFLLSATWGHALLPMPRLGRGTRARPKSRGSTVTSPVNHGECHECGPPCGGTLSLGVALPTGCSGPIVPSMPEVSPRSFLRDPSCHAPLKQDRIVAPILTFPLAITVHKRVGTRVGPRPRFGKQRNTIYPYSISWEATLFSEEHTRQKIGTRH